MAGNELRCPTSQHLFIFSVDLPLPSDPTLAQPCQDVEAGAIFLAGLEIGGPCQSLIAVVMVIFQICSKKYSRLAMQLLGDGGISHNRFLHHPSTFF